MAITIPVAATADDRTFQRIADRYERWGKDTGKKIGSALADGIDDPKIEKAFSKVGDAMSKVRAEEAKLQDLREKGAANSRIVAQAEALTRARNAETRATNDAIRAYDGMHASTSRLSSATSALSSALSGTRFGSIAADVSNLSGKFTAIGGTASKAGLAIGAIGATAVVAAKQLYDLGAQWDEMADKISFATGKTGADLDQMMDSVRRVASDTAAPLETINQKALEVAQSFKIAGPAADELVQQLSILDEKGNSVGTRDLARTMNLFGVETKDTSKVLDDLFAVSQKTGIPMQELATTLRSAGPAAKQFGFDIAQTAGLLGTFEQAGLDAGKVTPALTIFLKNAAKDGKEAGPELQEVVQRIQDMSDAGNDAGAANLAATSFGKSYVEILDAISAHKIDIEGLGKAFDANSEGIKKSAEKTEDLAEAFTKLKNNLSGVFAPAAKKVFDSINWQLEGILGQAKQLQDFFANPPDWAQWLLGSNALPDQAPGTPLTYPGSDQGPGRGSQSEHRGATGNPYGGGNIGGSLNMPKGALNGFEGGFYPLPRDSKRSTSSKTSVPYDQYSLGSIPLGSFPGEQQMSLPGRAIEQHTGPGGYEVDPQKVFDAQTGQLAAQQRLEDARSRILEQQSKNDVTAQERQDAQNQLILAERSYLKSQQDLLDAQQGTWKKAEDQTKQLTQGMDDFYSSLDKDLGLSKGLPGLAENLAKFIGNIAAAPLLGPLGAISAAQGGVGKTGSGLIAMAGAAGAFGPQFQDFSGVGLPGGLTPQQMAASGGVPGLVPGFTQAPGATQQAGPKSWFGAGGSSGSNLVAGPGGGALYGLPAGTDTGGYGSSGAIFPQWVHDIENAFGIKASTYSGHQESNRNEPGFAPNPGHQNRGIDWSGTVEDMQRFADYLKTIPQDLEQVIWQNPNTGQRVGVAGGQDVSNTGYYAGDYDKHGNHVHTRQSESIPLPMRPGAPQQQRGAAIGGPQAPLMGGGTPSSAGGDFFNQYGLPSPIQRDSGGPLPPGVSVVQNNTGQNEHVVNPQGQVGNQHVSQMFPGPGPGNNPMAGTPAQNVGTGATQIGGTEPKSQNGASQGAGGGIFGAGVSAASMAADSFAPGSGAAVQIAGQEIQRAIKAGGQFAGIVAGGLMETFLPTGASEIANDNWVSRIAGGFAGMAPQLPNMAGKSPTPVPKDQLPAAAPSQSMPLPEAPGGANKDGGGPTIIFNNTLNSPNHPINADHVKQLEDAQRTSYQAGMPQVGR